MELPYFDFARVEKYRSFIVFYLQKLHQIDRDPKEWQPDAFFADCASLHNPCQPKVWAAIGEPRHPHVTRSALLEILLFYAGIWAKALKGLSFFEVQAKVNIDSRPLLTFQ